MIFSVLVVAPALAGSEPAARSDQDSGLFKRLDADGDGYVDPQEAPGDQRRLFDRLLRTSDRDRDGRLSAAELSDGLQPSTAEKPVDESPGGKASGAKYIRVLLVKLDADGDQTLTRSEAPAELRTSFDEVAERADYNKDGQITRFELNRLGPKLAGVARQSSRRLRWDVDEELAKLTRQQGDAVFRFDNPIGPLEALSDPKRAKQLFDQFDTDGDQQLTIEEVPEPARDRFGRLIARADTNRDGVMTRDEYLAAAKRLSRFMQLAAERGRPLSPADAAKPSATEAVSTEAVPAEPVLKKPVSKKSVPKKSVSIEAAAAPASSSETESLASRLLRRLVKRTDSDGDGRIARSEARGTLARRFGEVDADGDGVLDTRELAAEEKRLSKRLQAADKQSAGKQSAGK
ncbi:MAG: hypothetical protein AAF596_03870 [Planctomycetota bacterium]